MPDYKLGKIYRLSNGQLVYIGSTAQPYLSMRLGQHKADYNLWVKTGKKYTTSFELFKIGTPTIELIESYPCNSKDELNAREGHHQRATDCVNKNMAGQTAAEYRNANQAKISERMKHYYDVNKAKINERTKHYYDVNKAKICERTKLYYDVNKAKINERTKLYREGIKRIERLTLFIQNHVRICSE